MRAAGLAAESFVSSGAVHSAAGQHQTPNTRPRAESLPGQRVSRGPGKGACDLEQAQTPSEGGQLRPGAAGEETGGTNGQRILMLECVALFCSFYLIC